MRLTRILMSSWFMLCAGAATAADRTLVALTDSGAGTYHVAADVGATAADFLLDTGSAYVVLNRATLKPLIERGEARAVRRLRAVMADNRETTVKVYQVASLTLADGCVAHDIEAVALPGAGKNILGLSALRRLAPFTLHFDPSMLEISCDGGIASPALAAR